MSLLSNSFIRILIFISSLGIIFLFAYFYSSLFWNFYYIIVAYFVFGLLVQYFLKPRLNKAERRYQFIQVWFDLFLFEIDKLPVYLYISSTVTFVAYIILNIVIFNSSTIFLLLLTATIIAVGSPFIYFKLLNNGLPYGIKLIQRLLLLSIITYLISVRDLDIFFWVYLGTIASFDAMLIQLILVIGRMDSLENANRRLSKLSFKMSQIPIFSFFATLPLQLLSLYLLLFLSDYIVDYISLGSVSIIGFVYLILNKREFDLLRRIFQVLILISYIIVPIAIGLVQFLNILNFINPDLLTFIVFYVPSSLLTGIELAILFNSHHSLEYNSNLYPNK